MPTPTSRHFAFIEAHRKKPNRVPFRTLGCLKMMNMRYSLLIIGLLAFGSVACKKKEHKLIAAKNDGKVWAIDQMSYSLTDTGVVQHDTLLYDAGSLTFVHEKRRFENGTGTAMRYEYAGGAWQANQEQAFTWAMIDDDLQIIYEDGTVEAVELVESKRNSQFWQSTVEWGTATITRTYHLSKFVDENP